MITIFTDGSSRGNPGPGGWGAIVRTGTVVKELGGGESKTTNNRMEMTASIEALRFAKDFKESITLYTDSKYTIDGATKWILGWQKNGWQTKNKTEVLNRDLWEQLAELCSSLSVSWNYVGGHIGIPGNERVDAIAQGFASGVEMDLYDGAKEHYAVNLDTTTSSQSKSKSSDGKAFSYIALLDGTIHRFSSWTECEKAVKGKKAKFRKALSPSHEKEIMQEWGVVEN